MAVLVDTCIWIPAFNPQASEHAVVRRALRLLGDAGETLIVTPQNIAEFWNVGTRPAESNGRGLTVDQVKKMVNIICRVSRIEYETEHALTRWRDLVERHGVQGVAVHDARLVAVMLACDIRQILTRNARDFLRYEVEGISVATPQAVVDKAG